MHAANAQCIMRAMELISGWTGGLCLPSSRKHNIEYFYLIVIELWTSWKWREKSQIPLQIVVLSLKRNGIHSTCSMKLALNAWPSFSFYSWLSFTLHGITSYVSMCVQGRGDRAEARLGWTRKFRGVSDSAYGRTGVVRAAAPRPRLSSAQQGRKRGSCLSWLIWLMGQKCIGHRHRQTHTHSHSVPRAGGGGGAGEGVDFQFFFFLSSILALPLPWPWPGPGLALGMGVTVWGKLHFSGWPLTLRAARLWRKSSFVVRDDSRGCIDARCCPSGLGVIRVIGW